ncbi:hypothetical protein [Flagellimonas sp. CMM7]|uniref:hypothetical protein n=1 Tax=Flagellimonas sp. CMM7 TaxID=2654676 RepID=UPI0013D84412|nr:hypothetical protein [Flagellimonas sp. CMM7]UII80281.1 hypothetical protein LV704_01925 [Flagellimonas sp. CMM7]
MSFPVPLERHYIFYPNTIFHSHRKKKNRAQDAHSHMSTINILFRFSMAYYLLNIKRVDGPPCDRTGLSAPISESTPSRSVDIGASKDPLH